MTEQELYSLRFPIGEFEKPETIRPSTISSWISIIKEFPEKLNGLTHELSSQELNWRYRPAGWTIKQVVHHCADSHMNSIIRFKLALTEEIPVIRPYFEDRWAELPDSQNDAISDSVLLLRGLHAKWGELLESLSESDLKKKFIHPESEQTITLAENIGFYAWHSQHHLSHIEQAIQNKGVFNE